MPRNDLIPTEQRAQEGVALRQEWDKYRMSHPGITQDKFCAEANINQGQLQRWFKGEKQIPEHRLVQLAKAWGFDARTIRPQILQTLHDYQAATNNATRELQERWSRLSAAQRREALRYLALLERAGETQDSV